MFVRLALLTVLSITFLGDVALAHSSRGATKKLSPTIRVIPLDNIKESIPLEKIKPFLKDTHVIEIEDFDKAPYIVSSRDGRVFLQSGDTVFIKGINEKSLESYKVVNKELRSLAKLNVEGTNAFIAEDKGDAVILDHADPATAILKNNPKEVLVGDRLVSFDSLEFDDIEPKPAKTKVDSRVIHLFTGAQDLGRFGVIAIAGGKKQGVEIGDILTIYKKGPMVKNTQITQFERIQLPKQKIGEILVFRTFKTVSFAIITSATQAIKENALVAN